MFNNPEFIRNVRSNLRLGKTLTTVAVAAALSLVIAFSVNHIVAVPAIGPRGWGFLLLRVLFWLQALVLAAGGGIACVNAIYKEKDQNTFDFQRVTRLSPLELALGKLFGAPIFMYFLCLCTMPLVIFAAVKGERGFTFVVVAYAVLFIGSITVHAFALLISLLTVRGSHTTAIMLVLVMLWVFSNVFTLTSNYLQLAPLSPFYASELVVQNNISEPVSTGLNRDWNAATSTAVDVFFGRNVQHCPVLIILDAILIAWFLLALARNIKRDPNQYELYSPLQSLGIIAFINLVLLAFVNWHSAPLMDIQGTLLTINGIVVGAIGLAHLRNRDRTRRILRAQTNAAQSWINLSWPAPFLAVAAIGASVLVSVSAGLARDPQTEWNTTFNIFRAIFFSVWIVRDTQFLQWMMLHRGKRPLFRGMLYLTVFYACAWMALSAFGTFRDADRTPFTAFFLPTPIYYLDHGAWSLRPAIWGAAFVAQWLFVGLFIFLQRKAILELARPASAELDPVPVAAIG
jgi:hypothetical protein